MELFSKEKQIKSRLVYKLNNLSPIVILTLEAPWKIVADDNLIFFGGGRG